MQDNPDGGELDPANDVRRCCKKNSSFVLSCIDKRTKEGCDGGSEVRTVQFYSLAPLFAKLFQPGDSKVTFTVFESSCHLLLPI